MKLKSLLIGSAAVMAVSTGTAKAADAIVMAEPEPMEYVRICDVYGTGFFYIPGTETCMHINGYYRFEIRIDPNGWNWFSRFQLNVDVRSETEWGTLRGYAEGRFDYGVGPYVGIVAGAPAVITGYNTTSYLNQGFIEIITGSGTLRMGKSDTPYARFLGYGGDAVFDGTYGYRNGNEISYTFRGSNGFSAIIALIDDGDGDFMPDVEGGINFAQGWGSFGVIAGYDESLAQWGAKAVLRWRAANGSVSGSFQVLYSGGAAAGPYQIGDPGGAAGNVAPWSILAHVKGQFTATTAAFLQAQWFSNTGGFEIVGGLDLRPVTDFRIRPEIRYRSTNATWAAIIRFDRNIP
ncbi:MAG: porin [Rhizobiaceae bacterium]|nr:porin [Rhizobiaceae bacterium]